MKEYTLVFGTLSEYSSSKESTFNARVKGDKGSFPGSDRYTGEGNGNLLEYSCLKKFHGQRSLVGYSPWGHKEPDMMELLKFTYPCFYKDAL